MAKLYNSKPGLGIDKKVIQVPGGYGCLLARDMDRPFKNVKVLETVKWTNVNQILITPKKIIKETSIQ